MRPIKAFGEEKGMKEWLDDDRCVVEYDCLKWRLGHGWEPEEALVIPSKRVSRMLVDAFGERKSPKEWEKDHRCIVSNQVVRRRILAGWEHEVALTTPVVQTKYKDRVGKTYGNLKVVGLVDFTKAGNLTKGALCECSICGKQITLDFSYLIYRKSSKCFCSRGGQAKVRRSGLSKHPLYSIWSSMNVRSNDGRCSDWENSFVAFYEWAMENGWKKGMHVRRLDTSKGFSPENCVIMKTTVDMFNTRTGLVAFGALKTLGEWSKDRRCKVSYSALKRRLMLGMNVEDAISREPHG